MRKQGCQPITSGPKWHRYIWSFVPYRYSSSSSRTLSFFAGGQKGRALNYQLSTGPPTKSNCNYQPVTRPGEPVSPLFFLPRSFLLYPLHEDLFRTYTRMKNNARIGEVCHQAAGTLHIREAEHTWAPRGAQHPEAERVQEIRRYD